MYLTPSQNAALKNRPQIAVSLCTVYSPCVRTQVEVERAHYYLARAELELLTKLAIEPTLSLFKPELFSYHMCKVFN